MCTKLSNDSLSFKTGQLLSGKASGEVILKVSMTFCARVCAYRLRNKENANGLNDAQTVYFICVLLHTFVSFGCRLVFVFFLWLFLLGINKMCVNNKYFKIINSLFSQTGYAY